MVYKEFGRHRVCLRLMQTLWLSICNISCLMPLSAAAQSLVSVLELVMEFTPFDGISKQNWACYRYVGQVMRGFNVSRVVAGL